MLKSRVFCKKKDQTTIQNPIMVILLIFYNNRAMIMKKSGGSCLNFFLRNDNGKMVSASPVF